MFKYLARIHIEIYGTILGWLIVGAVVTVPALYIINEFSRNYVY
jgi:hypothetical protein